MTFRFLLIILSFTAFFYSEVSAIAKNKVALVIGNDQYQNLSPDQQLAKAVNDARSVGKTLEKLGFTVILGENLDRQSMVDQIFNFTQKLSPGDTAAFFYAGHGVAVGGANYLLPSDVRQADTGEEARLRNMAIGEADIVADIQERKTDIVLMMIDACRDNPFRKPGSTRSVGGPKGLARVPEAQGIFAIYSAGFGQSALDSLGADDPENNSVFTRVLVPALQRPGVHLADMMIDIRQEVAALARTISHEQNPAYYDQTQGGRIFLSGEPAADTKVEKKQETAAVIAPPVPAIPPSDRRGTVGRVWNMKEGNEGWTGIWTRRGTSDTFDGVNFDANQDRFDLSAPEMTITDNEIAIVRRTPTAACIYSGRLDEDQLGARGTYGCNHVHGLFEWTATIDNILPEGPKNDWRGQVWREWDTPEWPGEWKRRGMSSMFDAVWRHESGAIDIAPLYITIEGNEVTVRRHQEKGTCTYKGTRQKNGRSIKGKAKCDWTPEPFDWQAEIVK